MSKPKNGPTPCESYAFGCTCEKCDARAAWLVRRINRPTADLIDAEISSVSFDGDLAWLTVEFPGGTTAVLKVCISEIEWRNHG